VANHFTYKDSVARLRRWSLDNPTLIEAVEKFGTGDAGPWLLLDGRWLTCPMPHHVVGDPHKFMEKTGSIRWFLAVDKSFAAVEFIGPPTVSQIIQLNGVLPYYRTEVDLTYYSLHTELARLLDTTILDHPALGDLNDFWVWVERGFNIYANF